MRALLVLLICLQIGCSRGGVKVETGKSEVGGQDSCALFTLADVQAVYGSDMAPSKRNVAAGGPAANLSTCSYQTDKDPMSMATLSVIWTKSAANPLSNRESYIAGLESSLGKETFSSMKMEQIEFQGLPAIWAAGLGQMVVFKRGASATLLADAAPGKSRRQTVEMLMAKVAGRL